MSRRLFTDDFKARPYWWDAAPLATETTDLPARADVAIIGAGYTGLHAAIRTARAGLVSVVIDAEAAGFGCSTRNGGQISTSIKPSYAQLCKRYGPDLAVRILQEGRAALDFIQSFVTEEKIDCAFSVSGRFDGIHHPRLYDKIARDIATKHPGFDPGAYMVPKSEQRDHIDTDAYHGGVVYPRNASVDPARYHRGLLQVALAAGVQVVSNCRVNTIDRIGAGFELQTERGSLRADKVVLATNGYSGALNPWHQRRIIPIGSYIIATDVLPSAVMDRLLPTNRMICDTRKVVFYYRPSPDRKRILFGGRVSLNETDPRKSGPKLHAELVHLFPELRDTKISHSWAGTVAFTFDSLMHTGQDRGLFYAMGYCGSGVGLSGYLGMRIGQQAAGLSDGATAFDDIPFPTRPLYAGNPWFLGPAITAYRLQDRFGWF